MFYNIYFRGIHVTKEFRNPSDTELLNNGTSSGIEWYLNKNHFRILNSKNIVAIEKHILV
jgi:hypothetical protein